MSKRQPDALPLGRIKADPAQFQRRRKPWAERTVGAIVREGFDPDKFDPLPVFLREGQWIVGGDGHSRYEALRRLAAAGRPLPTRIPVRVVAGPDKAARLSMTANMNRTDFDACEEARIFKERLARGETAAQIAEDSHRSPGYVTSRVLLAELSSAMQDLVGQPCGLPVDLALVFARGVVEHGFDPAAQQRIWLELLKDGDYTPRAFKLALSVIAGTATKSSRTGLLFELPANLKAVVGDLSAVGKRVESARRALLAVRANADIYCPALRKAVERHVAPEIERLDLMLEAKARALGETVTKKRGRTAPVTDTGRLQSAMAMLQAIAAKTRKEAV